jgi:hypothetical protein
VADQIIYGLIVGDVDKLFLFRERLLNERNQCRHLFNGVFVIKKAEVISVFQIDDFFC